MAVVWRSKVAAQVAFDAAATTELRIGALTGRRFLDGYASDEDQYRALLKVGATVASGWACARPSR